LASKEGSTKTVTRVKNLLRKERQRYDGKLRRMDMRKRMLMRMQAGEQRGPDPNRKRLSQKAMEEAYMRKARGEGKNEEVTKKGQE